MGRTSDLPRNAGSIPYVGVDKVQLGALPAAGPTLQPGEVVRIPLGQDRRVTRAQADVDANTRGFVGVIAGQLQSAPGSGTTVIINGSVPVLLEPGLTPAAGEPLFISAATAGRATNVEPALSRPFAIIFDTARYAIDGTVVCVLTGVGADANSCCDCDLSLYRVYDDFDMEPTGNPDWLAFNGVDLIPAQGGTWKISVGLGVPLSFVTKPARAFAFAGNAGNIPNPPLRFKSAAYITQDPVGTFAALALADLAHTFVLGVITFGDGFWNTIVQSGGPAVVTPLGIPVKSTCDDPNVFEAIQQSSGDVRFILNGVDLGVFPVPAPFRAHLYAPTAFVQQLPFFPTAEASVFLDVMCASEGKVCLDDPGDIPFPTAGDLIQTQTNYQSNDVTDNADTVNWTTIPVAVNLVTGANSILAWAEISSAQDTVGQFNEFRWILDGVPVSASFINVGVGSTFNTASVPGATIPPATSFPQGNAMLLPKQMVTAGAHSVGIQWRVSGGTGLLRPGTFPDRESISIAVAEVAV